MTGSGSVPPRLVCLGNLTVDDVILPDGTARAGCMGGDALYAALAARLWEPAVEMVTPVGEDLPPEVTAQILQAGFSFAGLPRRSVPTIHNQVRYDDHGGRSWTIHTSPEHFHALSPLPRDVPPAYLAARTFLVAAMSLDAQEQLVGWLRTHTTATVALDVQEDYIKGNEDRLDALIRQVDVFMPSEEEVRRLVGHQDWLRAAQHWASGGPRVVVIKRGAAGSLVYDALREHVCETPAFPTLAVDTTGAGDAYCGGFLATLILEPDRFDRAARAGAVSASFAIAGFGMDSLLRARPAEATDRLARWEEALPMPANRPARSPIRD